MVDQAEIHRMARSEDVEERKKAVEGLKNNFAILEDKKQAWEDMHRLAMDNDHIVRELTIDTFGSIILHITDKHQVWQDLHHLIQDENKYVRWAVASALGSIFSRVPDKEQILLDLNLLTEDEEEGVCASANYAIGKAYIFRASEAINEDDFRKYLEKAIEFFEISSNQALNFKNQARFCHPFYRSFYMITFGKYDAEAEVKKYFDLSKNAIWGSKNKKTLLEAVENLGNALKEAQKAQDFSDVKADLNAYRRYCDRACELLEKTEEKAPGASSLIRRGLPIIDERIKGIIAEIQEKAKTLCGETKNTTFRDAGIELNRIGQDFSQIRDPIGLEKSVYNMQTVLSAICAKMPEKERGEVCTLLRQAKEEQYIEDKINLINIVLGKISSQISAGKSMGKYVITNSKVQIAEGEGIVQSMDSSENQKKESGLFDFMNKSAIAATLAGFGAFVFSEFFEIFPSNYNKHVISVVLAIIIFTIILILTRKYYNK